MHAELQPYGILSSHTLFINMCSPGRKAQLYASSPLKLIILWSFVCFTLAWQSSSAFHTHPSQPDVPEIMRDPCSVYVLLNIYVYAQRRSKHHHVVCTERIRIFGCQPTQRCTNQWAYLNNGGNDYMYCEAGDTCCLSCRGWGQLRAGLLLWRWSCPCKQLFIALL